MYKRQAIESGECAGKAVPEVAEIMGVVKKKFPEASHENMCFGSTIVAVKPLSLIHIFVHQSYKHLMNGVSHMLPFVVGGGILIACLLYTSRCV